MCSHSQPSKKLTVTGQHVPVAKATGWEGKIWTRGV